MLVSVYSSVISIGYKLWLESIINYQSFVLKGPMILGNFCKILHEISIMFDSCCYPNSSKGWGHGRWMEPQKLSNSSGAGPEVVERQRAAKSE